MPEAAHLSREWRALRAIILERDLWTCRYCGCALMEGRSHARSAVVDHIRPWQLRPDLFLDPDNNWSVCKGDHDGPIQAIEMRLWPNADAIAREKTMRYTVGPDGAPLDLP